MFELNIYQSENKTVICCVEVRYVHVHGSILFDRRFQKKLGNGKVHRMGTDLRKGGGHISCTQSFYNSHTYGNRKSTFEKTCVYQFWESIITLIWTTLFQLGVIINRLLFRIYQNRYFTWNFKFQYYDVDPHNSTRVLSRLYGISSRKILSIN